ncbi:DUF29 family protein [Planktothrix mougeotii]|uniref:DUF29 family protein n=1 Tax=Planktothrix mougeotii LEGE 06226 TaxID=1828728 RepID=A0ABR9UCW3_9CYAN|nr:DUF29 family protein [Planktothrix mougeotii]MBE9144310.1 DUF29 family protein [Planktothrix mougeotii LEGE 06226]
MINSSTTKPNTLYEKDFYLWIQTTAQQLKENKLNEIDEILNFSHIL